MHMICTAKRGGTLSVVLAGHPKLKNDLRRPSMIGLSFLF
jgi:type II secretory pathway predicted ATPase ExeA